MDTDSMGKRQQQQQQTRLMGDSFIKRRSEQPVRVTASPGKCTTMHVQVQQRVMGLEGVGVLCSA